MKMKKRTLGILAAIVCVVIAGASFAVGQWIKNDTKQDGNKISVGQAKTITVGGDSLTATNKFPGDSIVHTVTVALDGLTGYKLKLTSITTGDGDKTTADLQYWTVNGQAFASDALTLTADATEGSNTLTFLFDGDAPSSQAGTILVFTVELVK